MFNLCSEKTYDTSFFHERVERVLIDDHNVPTLKQMLEFADTVSGTCLDRSSSPSPSPSPTAAPAPVHSPFKVREWLGEHPDNVIVVHCKGGKGR